MGGDCDANALLFFGALCFFYFVIFSSILNVLQNVGDGRNLQDELQQYH